jgi:two-component system sensor histidine kinase KdpD
MENFFTETNLTALREMAMRHTAHEVEDKLHTPPARDSGGAPARRERLLVCLTGRPASAILIRRGKRVADYLQGDCLAIHVAPPEAGDGGGQSQDREAVERHMNFARNLRIQTHIVEAEEVPRAITEFARAQRITQIFMGRSQPQPWWRRFRYSVVQQVVRQASDMQITIVAERRR